MAESCQGQSYPQLMNNQNILSINKKNKPPAKNTSNSSADSGPSKEAWFWLLSIIIGAGILVIIASYLSV